MDIDSRLDKLIASIEADREAAEAQMKEDRERTKAEMAETWRRMEASAAETDRVVKEVSQQLGGMGNNNGAAAENYFYNSFDDSKVFGNEKFDYADKNVRGRDRGLRDEYDIVLYNGQSIGIIEVKYSAEKKHIAQTLNKATTFRQVFPQYAGFKIYLGLASFVFEDSVERDALDAGLAVIKQVGKNMVVQDERMKKF